MKFAKRLDAVPPYLFAELERKVAEAERAGVDVISLGIGDPDLPTPPAVIDALAEAARDPRTHQYPTNHGTEEFRTAAADFYRDRFGVELDPNGEVIPVLGGKEGVGHIALAALDPGDVCLAPDPGYPPYTSGPVFAGAQRPLPAAARGERLPARARGRSRREAPLPQLPEQPDRRDGRARLLRARDRRRPRRDLIVVHDNAYSEVAFDGYRPPSFLEAPGAKEVGVEIFSLSKGWNMTGWRAGLVAGNAEIVERYRQLKTNLDSGMSEAVQHAAAVALTDEREFPREISEVYARRRDRLATGLQEIGLEVRIPRATPYFWVRVPEGHTSASFTELMLEQASVLVSPGDSYGPSGEGYVRLSLTVPDSRLEEAVDRITKALVIIQS